MFAKLRKKKDSHIGQLLKKIDGKHIQYAVEHDRITNTEKILGKNGGIAVSGEDIVILCEGKMVFRSEIATSKMGELMNLTGLSITGYDKISQSEKFVIA